MKRTKKQEYKINSRRHIGALARKGYLKPSQVKAALAEIKKY